jgi:hypothetical protein
MMKSKLLATLVISATLVGSAFYSAPSYAATGGSANNSGALFGNPGTGSSLFSLGALLGFGFVSNNGGTQLVLGANGDYKLAPTYGVGGYFSYNALSSLPGASSSLITLAPEANYYFEGQLTGFRIGGKAGVGFISNSVSTSASTASSSSTSFVVGPHIGYDFPIMSSVSFGGETNLLFYTANSGFSAFNLLGNLKYWF